MHPGQAGAAKVDFGTLATQVLDGRRDLAGLETDEVHPFAMALEIAGQGFEGSVGCNSSM